MSDSDFEDFEEPEEPEIVEDEPIGGGQTGNAEAPDAPETPKEGEGSGQNEREGTGQAKPSDQPEEPKTGEESTQPGGKKANAEEEQNQAESTQKETSEKSGEEGANADKKTEEKMGKNIEKTPEKKAINNISSAQKPASSFHPISQDSDANLNSKLSESFTMVTAEAKGEIRSGIDLKSDCHNLISPNNQKATTADATSKETQSAQTKSEAPEKKTESERARIQKKYPLLIGWASESKPTETKLENSAVKTVRKSNNNLEAKLEKSVLGRFRKLKMYKKLVQMKEEIQNNSCKEMKGLSRAESELLNEFLDGLFFLPDALSKDLLDIN